MKLGFIGVGNMGGPMCRHLMRAGHEMTVRDVNPAAVQRCTGLGASCAGSPEDVAARSDVVFASLPTTADVEQVVFGGEGLLAGARDGLIFVDLSTNLPGFARRVARELAARGGASLDAPIMGSPDQVESGTTAVVVGGEAVTFDTVRPLLQTTFQHVFHAGGHGAGLAVKLVNNLLNYCNLGVAREALSLAAAAGVKHELLSQVLRTRSWDGAFWAYVAEKIDERDYRADAAMDLSLFKTSSSGLTGKSLGMALQLGEELGVPLVLGDALMDLLRESNRHDTT